MNLIASAGMPTIKKNQGFTLIEIMVVVVIMGILAGLVGVAVFGNVDKAKVEAVKSDLRVISQALDLYRLDNNRYPSTDQGLDALVTRPDDAKTWPEEGYLKKKEVPLDPWNNPYNYISESNRNYDLYSFGADGVEGGEGYDADISAAEL
ncbi:MAG: type II secretion system major pseudopilin GspG [Pseudomonadales bacterium]|nr:type II secretion system major pseudopilin GspG [Pseudomonadales bacterium]